MGLSKYKLGDLIKQRDVRNSEGQYTLNDIKGISTGKEFIDTKANMDGVSLFSYKVVAQREFAYVADTSRRGEKIAIAFNAGSKPVLISSIYTVFRVSNEKKLLSNYLFMYFNRPEFDRYARFITNEGKFHTQESFAAQFDMKRLSEMFRNSTAEQKQQIRGVFVGMYRIGNIKSFLANDRESIVQLLEFIKADRSGDVGDRIQQLQYDWFIKNLEEIKRKLS